MDVHRVAHHAQVPEASPFNAQKWGDVQGRRPSRLIRPPSKKLPAPTVQLPMACLMQQKILQGMAALHRMLCA
jgi:hypothetical protein